MTRASVLTTLILLTLLACSALAATQDLTVSATVTGTCRFDSASNVNFGTLDQSATANATATGDLVFWCTKGTLYTLGDETNPTVADGSFSGTLIGAGTSDTIAYTLAYTNISGTGGGKTAPTSSVVTATILNNDYVNVSADTYSDTVTFTVTP